MEHQAPPLFVRGPAPIVRLVFFVALAIFLMILDARFKYIEPLRQSLLWIAYPMQRVATAPIALFDRGREFFTSQTTLQRENAELRAERLKAAQDLLTLEALRQENSSLRATLDAKGRVEVPALFAEVIYLGRDPFSRKVIIDRGSQGGVEVGQPVIDSTGVIGQVTRVHPLIAEVTLVIDKEHAVPIVVTRTGLRGIAFGSGDGTTMELRYLAANVDVAANDTLVTSGIDGVYPAGLPVATVQRVDKDANQAFARITLAPIGRPGQGKEVLVLGKPEARPDYPEDAREAPKRPTRRRAGAR
ncbi:MAG: rod shape-determining protein MreC [Burkholderiales bacterium]